MFSVEEKSHATHLLFYYFHSHNYSAIAIKIESVRKTNQGAFKPVWSYTSFSISFSTYSTVRTHFSPVTSSTYSSVRLVIVSPSTFSLSLTTVFPGFVRTSNFGKSALEGLSCSHAMLVPSPWISIKSSKKCVS